MSSERNRPAAKPRRRFSLFWMLIPLLIIIMLMAAILWWGLSSDVPDDLPAATGTGISATQIETSPGTDAGIAGTGENFAPIERSAESTAIVDADSEDSTSAPVSDPVPPRPRIELPKLSDSDTMVKTLASELSPEGTLLALLVPDSILLKVVRMIIALDEHSVVKDYRPLTSPEHGLIVQPINEEPDPDLGPRYRLDPRNYARYTAHVDLLAKLDMTRMAQLYHDLYPLLEQAYQQYGVDRGSFYDVTLRALDHVLEVPIRDESPILIQPKVFFEYQDPVVEKRTSIDKLLMRMGPENTQRVQAQLRTLKLELQRQKPAPPAP